MQPTRSTSATTYSTRNACMHAMALSCTQIKNTYFCFLCKENTWSPPSLPLSLFYGVVELMDANNNNAQVCKASNQPKATAHQAAACTTRPAGRTEEEKRVPRHEKKVQKGRTNEAAAVVSFLLWPVVVTWLPAYRCTGWWQNARVLQSCVAWRFNRFPAVGKAVFLEGTMWTYTPLTSSHAHIWMWVHFIHAENLYDYDRVACDCKVKTGLIGLD